MRLLMSPPHWTRRRLPCIAVYLSTGILACVAAPNASMTCGMIPDLLPWQQTLCMIQPNVFLTIGKGLKLGISECKNQFRNNRWNCLFLGEQPAYGRERNVGTREEAFMHAMESAGIAHAVTTACSQGNLSECGCALVRQRSHNSWGDWHWGGCSADVRYGIQTSRRFTDAREVDQSDSTLVNRHNYRVGRNILKRDMKLKCRCHGVLGACAFKTCWNTLPSFREVGFLLKDEFELAAHVELVRGTQDEPPLRLKVKDHLPDSEPRDTQLVYTELSSNYCERDRRTASFGTFGRVCNRTSPHTNGCELLCCGRGYSTCVSRRPTCDCKPHWCCDCGCPIQEVVEYLCN